MMRALLFLSGAALLTQIIVLVVVYRYGRAIAASLQEASSATVEAADDLCAAARDISDISGRLRSAFAAFSIH